MRAVLALLLTSCAALAAADAPLATLVKNSVTVEIRLADVAPDRAVLVATLTPKATGQPLHLYGIDNHADVGIATNLAVEPPAKATGPLTADVAAHDEPDADGGVLRVYKPGPVTVRLPIALPPGAAGTTVPVRARISYMACTEATCLPPVLNQAIELALPASAGAATPTPTPTPDAPRAALDADALRAVVRDELARQLDGGGANRIRFAHPRDRAEAEAAIRAANAADHAALVDFTGPSCNVCQRMAKTVLRQKPVVAAWNAQAPIEIDTDSSSDLAQWQQERFQTQNRPLYVRIAPDGAEARWSQPFATDDAATLARFLDFVNGRGAGSDVGAGDGLGAFLLLAVLGGLFTLVMPCTYPMIPFTLNFFAKQASSGHRTAPLAAFYAVGIILCFVAIGVVVTGVFGSTLATVSGHPVTNLVIGAVFVLLGLSLLGVFLLRLPTGLQNAVGGGRGGYLGALLMGLTFAITAFACTAPFAGSVLAAAVATGGGAWARAVGGMAVYASVIAVPFFLLALSPAVLRRLPRASGWMNEFKIVGGLVELGAALKFLVICDYHWHWHLFGRASVVACWAALAAICGVYVLGKLRFAADEPLPHVGPGRVLIGAAFLALAAWLAAGLAGADLGVLESFFPD